MHNKHKYPKNWQQIKEAIRVRDNWTCQHCRVKHGSVNAKNGRKIFLQVAHIDQNRHNNKPDNLMLLCPSCHVKMDRATNATSKPYNNENLQIIGLNNLIYINNGD